MYNNTQKKNDCWNRINKIIARSGMNTNAFARHIGLPRGENLYQIKRGNNGISRDVADRICKAFPEVNKLWLLTGEGAAFANTNTPGDLIPPPRNRAAHVRTTTLLHSGYYSAGLDCERRRKSDIGGSQIRG